VSTTIALISNSSFISMYFLEVTPLDLMSHNIVFAT
jgi:hypothetical protein